MQSYMVTRGIDSLQDVEDTQLLTGDGTGNNLFGIITEAAAYVDALADADAEEVDVLAKSWNQITSVEYQADGIVLNPTRLVDMLLKKDSQGRFLLPNIYTGQRPTIMGTPIFITTAIAANSFLTGAFRRGH